nr:hypothetical protein [Motiliproteus sp. SC1-56]
MRFSTDGRWVFAVNPHTDQVFVIDSSTNTVEYSVPVEGRPFSLTVSDAFVYVRSLEDEYVRMINVKELGRRDTPLVTKFAAGKAAPGRARDLPIADLMMPAPGEASMLVASPADLTVYYYMEGMNSPMGNFRNYGHLPRAVNVVDRTLRERNPGEYSAKVKIPAAGNYDVVFLLDSPRMLHCFEATAAVNPSLKKYYPPLAIEYLTEERKVAQGSANKVRFKLIEPKTQQPPADLEDVNVLYYNTSGRQRDTVLAKSMGDGIYEAEVTPRYPGAYYLWVSAPSMGVGAKQLDYFSLMSVPDRDASPTPVGDEKESDG